MKQEEQHIIQKLEAQKKAVKPSRELLSKIVAQLPASPAGGPADQQIQTFGAFQKEQRTFAWIRFAIPAAGVVALIGGVFFVSQISQTPENSNPVAISEVSLPATTEALVPAVSTERALSLASLQTEEQQIEEQIAFDDFFEDELQMQEIDAALAGF